MSINSLITLPRELLKDEIFSCLEDARDLNNCFCTCKHFKEIIETSPELVDKFTQQLDQYVQKVLFQKYTLQPIIPSFKSIYEWRNGYLNLETDYAYSLGKIYQIQKAFNAICPLKDQNNIMESFGLYPSQEIAERSRTLQKLAQSGGGLLLWYIAILKENGQMIELLLKSQHNPKKMVNLFTRDDFHFGFQLICHQKQYLSDQQLALFAEHGIQFNTEQLQALCNKRFQSSVLSLISYDGAIKADEKSFCILKNAPGYHTIRMLVEAGFPVSRLYLNSANGFLSYNDHVKRTFSYEQISYLINAGLKIEDADLSKALMEGPSYSCTSEIVRLFVKIGTLGPESVDQAMQRIYKDNMSVPQQGDDILTIEDNTLQLLVATNGIDKQKIKTYKRQIKDIIRKNGGASNGLKKILEVISTSKSFRKQYKLSQKFQGPFSEGLQKKLQKKEPLDLEAHHLSYALKFHHPKEIIELMLKKHQVPVEDFHLAVALQEGCSEEIIQLLMEKVPPQIYHLNCALQHQNSIPVISSLFDYWTKNNVHFEKYQLTNVLNNAKRWKCDPVVVDFLQNHFEKFIK